jgi:hypothetical protein
VLKHNKNYFPQKMGTIWRNMNKENHWWFYLVLIIGLLVEQQRLNRDIDRINMETDLIRNSMHQGFLDHTSPQVLQSIKSDIANAAVTDKSILQLVSSYGFTVTTSQPAPK